MSRLLYVCLRDPSRMATTPRAVATILERLRPDNLPRVAPKILSSGGILAAVSDGSDLVAVRDTCLAAGLLVEPGAWERPGTGRPDGAYALFRGNDATVEIVSDTLASRTVWYAMTDEMFVAATSQRAIVALLRDFDFNPAVIPWMLSTGTLGPGFSWDKRIRHVPGATTVTLDRAKWTLRELTEPARFPGDLADDHECRLSDVLTRVVGAARVADPCWAITLSGGIDSRVLLGRLQDTTGLRAVTWGLRSSKGDPVNDAQVARQLAEHFGLEHLYFETDLTEEPLDRFFARFVANGEGRIDKISGYADGFQLWSHMVQVGIRGIVRGDQVFGHRTVLELQHVPVRIGMTLWSDFAGVPPLDHFDLPSQTFPDSLAQRTGESLDTWRDRLQQQFRAPFVYGALSDLKLPYVEVLSPLLADSLVELIRRLPDAQRTNKALLRRIAGAVAPSVPFARSGAVLSPGGLLKSPRVVEFLRENISGEGAQSPVPRKFIDFAIAGLEEASASPRRSPGRRIRHVARTLAPTWVIRRRKRVVRAPQLDHNRLAFRAFLLSQATRVLADDAECLGKTFT